VTVSVGVAAGPPSSWRALVQEADRAMYRAKKNGRDRVEITEVVRKTA
jgi:diguanylate cyclase (GGDEF)-like protein